MDGNDQNQNVDGFKPAETQAPVSNVDGFVTNPRPETTAIPVETADSAPESTDATAEQSTPAPNHEVEVAKLKEQKKGMAIWLVVLLVVLFAGAAAAGVYFFQSNQAKKDLDAANAKTSQAQKDLAAQTAATQQSATQQQINDLNKQITDLKTQNAALQKTIDTQTAYIKTLTDVATKLKTTCGTACASITIPPAPTTTSTTTNTTTTTKTN